jgi:hypothetical protein
MFVSADGRVAVIPAAHDGRPRGRPHLEERTPGGVGIRGHTGGVEEDADRIAIEAVLYEYVVVGRDEEVVSSSDAADAECNAVIKELLPVGDIDDAERCAAADLLYVEDVADIFLRKAAFEAVRGGKFESSALGPVQLLQVYYEVKADVAEPCEAMSHPAARVTEGVGHEREGRDEAAVLQPLALAVPVAEHVFAGHDQLERCCW